MSKDIAALFMGCGLGKTASCLAVIAKKLLQEESIGVLVVAPKRVCNLVWPFEVLKWDQLSWLRVANLRTPEGWKMLLERRAHIYVINYEQLPKLAEQYFKGRRQKKWAFDTLVYDELTKVKNRKSKRVRAVKPYFYKLKRRWGLTGTPTPNGLLDLFGQVRALDTGERFGISYPTFRAKYFKPMDWKERVWKPKDQASRDAIYEKISDLALTLKRSDYLKIPDTTTYDIEVALPVCARKQYKELAKELYLLLQGQDVTAVNSAVLINKLLQVTSGCIYSDFDPHTQKRQTIKIHEAKIKAVVALAKSLGEPVLVVCNFRHEQTEYHKALPGAVRFDSAKTDRAQVDLEASWNAGKIKALIAHPASIGHGLNLQEGGRIVIWTTPTYDREFYDQTNDRVARMGQEHPTEIYHILCSGTVDDAVLTALESKDTEQNNLLEALKKFQVTYEARNY